MGVSYVYARSGKKTNLKMVPTNNRILVCPGLAGILVSCVRGPEQYQRAEN
jgi:hypothetical protein